MATGYGEGVDGVGDGQEGILYMAKELLSSAERLPSADTFGWRVNRREKVGGWRARYLNLAFLVPFSSCFRLVFRRRRRHRRRSGDERG